MNANWVAHLAGRIVANAVVGAIAAAIVGAGCVASAGFGIGLGWSYNTGEAAFVGGYIGAMLGAASGALIGFLIYGIAAARAAPGETFMPLCAIFKGVSLGQVAGTLSAATAFWAFEFVRALVFNQSWSEGAGADLFSVMFGTPALMMCGAIAGALWKRASTGAPPV